MGYRKVDIMIGTKHTTQGGYVDVINSQKKEWFMSVTSTTGWRLQLTPL